MNPVGKALWYIESHLTRDLSLEEIAAGAETSRFHLTRAFGEATGRSPMRYARARRLTRAAQTLARGAPDIMAVAIPASRAPQYPRSGMSFYRTSVMSLARSVTSPTVFDATPTARVLSITSVAWRCRASTNSPPP